jgi:hypothetical protein
MRFHRGREEDGHFRLAVDRPALVEQRSELSSRANHVARYDVGREIGIVCGRAIDRHEDQPREVRVVLEERLESDMEIAQFWLGCVAERSSFAIVGSTDRSRAGAQLAVQVPHTSTGERA